MGTDEEKEEPLRLDQVLVSLGYAKSRERAKTLIKEGGVFVNGKKATKASLKCVKGSEIKVTTKDIPWVSRGGLKMEKALDTWPIDVADKVCLDIGASTGGFTEVLLQKGAKKVYALDVGRDQLDEKLRFDTRVVVIEEKNIRDTTGEIFAESIDIITVDVSFISLSHVLPKVSEFLKEGGEAVVLVKPQFEVGKDRIKKGVVKDPVLHEEVIGDVKSNAVKEGLVPMDVIDSPIKGVGGNKEFLIYLKRGD